MQIHVENQIPRSDALLGLIRAEGVHVATEPEGLAEALQQLLAGRQQLPPELEARRQAVRDLLRNGRYKPTGRAKPASEYLLREAQAGGFPRINGPVDVANYISLLHMLPVSLWDLDRAASTRFRFRLGRAGEAYVFNTAGQQIDLTDLIVGCRVDPDSGADEPIVNPVKDSLATKTDARPRASWRASMRPPRRFLWKRWRPSAGTLRTGWPAAAIAWRRPGPCCRRSRP